MTTDPPKEPKPGRWQFSLRTLLIAVACVAVALGAISNAVVAALLLIATFGVLLVSLVGAALCRGRRQAFWIGVAVMGWGCVIVNAIPLPSTQIVGALLAETLQGIRAMTGTPRHFLSDRVDSALFTPLFAYLGGLLARYFYSTRVDEK